MKKKLVYKDISNRKLFLGKNTLEIIKDICIYKLKSKNSKAVPIDKIVTILFWFFVRFSDLLVEESIEVKDLVGNYCQSYYKMHMYMYMYI